MLCITFFRFNPAPKATVAPDKNLCRDVFGERVRRVISGYRNKKGQAVDGLGEGFAYLRCRRIPAATVFRGIQHAQVWTALQLIHDVALTPYQPALPMQATENRRWLVIYLPKLNDAVLNALQTEFSHRGIDVDDTGLERALNRIMAVYPSLIRKAARTCAARFKEVFDAAPCPNSWNCRWV